jgi:hypothetical protein
MESLPVQPLRLGGVPAEGGDGVDPLLAQVAAARTQARPLEPPLVETFRVGAAEPARNDRIAEMADRLRESGRAAP